MILVSGQHSRCVCRHRSSFMSFQELRPWENAGRKKILRPCPKGCGKEYGAREMKAHIPRCDGPPATPPAPHARTGTRR